MWNSTFFEFNFVKELVLKIGYKILFMLIYKKYIQYFVDRRAHGTYSV